MGEFDLGRIGRQLCDAAFTGAVQHLLDGYIVIGGTVAGQAGLAPIGGGIDLVWDLWNEQFSAFTYPSLGLSSDVAASVGGAVHVGFGTGRFDGVHSAWSGTFHSVEYSLSVDIWRVVSLSGQIQGFTSPDGTMVGGLVGGGASASVPDSLSKMIKFPLGGTAVAATGEWTPYDQLTALMAGNRRGDLVQGRYAYLNLEEGELGVATHMVSVMGVTPLSLALGAYAIAVAMAKRNMEDKGITNREQGLRDLHLTLCSQAYRRIQGYAQDVPSGTDERHYDDYAVQRTARGNYIITETHSVPATGEWRSTRRLHRPDATLIDSYRFWMAIGNAPNGFVDGRSYPRAQFTDVVGDRLSAMQRQ